MDFFQQIDNIALLEPAAHFELFRSISNLQVDLILLLDEFDYPPVTIDDVYKEVLEQAENFKKYAG